MCAHACGAPIYTGRSALRNPSNRRTYSLTRSVDFFYHNFSDVHAWQYLLRHNGSQTMQEFAARHGRPHLLLRPSYHCVCIHSRSRLAELVQRAKALTPSHTLAYVCISCVIVCSRRHRLASSSSCGLSDLPARCDDEGEASVCVCACVSANLKSPSRSKEFEPQ